MLRQLLNRSRPAVVAALGLTAFVAMPERADACGACVCFEYRWARPPLDAAPLNTRILIDAATPAALGTPIDLSALRLRRRSDGAPIPFVLEPVGTKTQLYWLIPSALEPLAYYDLDIEGTPDWFETFVTSDATDVTAPALGEITVEHTATDGSCVPYAGATFALDLSADSGPVDTALLQVDVDLPGGVKRTMALIPSPGLAAQSLPFGSTTDPSQPVADCFGPTELADGVTGVSYPASVRAFDFAGNASEPRPVVFDLQPVQTGGCGDPLNEGDAAYYYDDTPDAAMPNYGDDAVYPSSDGAGCVCGVASGRPVDGSGSAAFVVVAGLVLAVRTRRRERRRPGARSAPSRS
jgi:hypothetical protein